MAAGSSTLISGLKAKSAGESGIADAGAAALQHEGSGCLLISPLLQLQAPLRRPRSSSQARNTGSQRGRDDGDLAL